jgi:hypothetical protein
MLEGSKQAVTTAWVWARDEVADFPSIALIVIISLALAHLVF